MYIASYNVYEYLYSLPDILFVTIIRIPLVTQTRKESQPY